jgi:hypothetical protein
MTLTVDERRTFVRMVADRVEAENRALDQVAGGAR